MTNSGRPSSVHSAVSGARHELSVEVLIGTEAADVTRPHVGGHPDVGPDRGTSTWILADAALDPRADRLVEVGEVDRGEIQRQFAEAQVVDRTDVGGVRGPVRPLAHGTAVGQRQRR